jgi:hypothetical protein
LAELLEANRQMPRKQRYTVKRMWETIRGEGFTGGYTTVKDAVRQLRQAAGKEVFMMFVMAFPRECTEAFLEAHAAAFSFFGFVPSRIRYDNTKVAVAQILGPHERKLTTAFARLVLQAPSVPPGAPCRQ